MAVGALRALREHGLRVPEDISVLGYDNDEISVYIEPPLTSNSQNRTKLVPNICLKSPPIQTWIDISMCCYPN
jgi:DNA-binding LacI/PurR family transcriptional regulator